MKRWVGMLLVLAGCYRTPVLAPGAEAVRLTTTASAVQGCESRGLVRASDGRGGFFGKGQASAAVDRQLRNAAAKAGANLVLIADLQSGFWGSSGRGEAFRCP